MAVEDRMFRALGVLRIVLLANTVAWTLLNLGGYEHPTWGLLAVATMAAWSALAGWAQLAERRRTPLLFAADLVLTALALVSTPLIKGPGWSATVPGFWIVGALLAWAVRGRVWGGLVAGVVLACTDLLLRDHVSQSNWGNIFLLVIAGLVVGWVCQSVQRLAAERSVAERGAAIAAERARLARAVHDGVLQVLALAQRRGNEPGGDRELGLLAGEQEVRLRSLIRQQDTLEAPAGERTDSAAPIDVTRAVETLLAGRALRGQVIGPAEPVTLPGPSARELVAAVGACLDNVSTHVGEQAPVWILIEDLQASVVVSVRDDGPGIPPGRAEQALAEGRLGLSESIRGRLRDLGGTATLISAAGQGTEWELSVPRDPTSTPVRKHAT